MLIANPTTDHRSRILNSREKRGEGAKNALSRHPLGAAGMAVKKKKRERRRKKIIPHLPYKMGEHNNTGVLLSVRQNCMNESKKEHRIL